MISDSVTLVEVGLRDGLQNESVILPLEIRLDLAQKLSLAGLRRIEIGSFVSPQWVPSMAMSEELTKKALAKIQTGEMPRNTELSALVPNEVGFYKALNSGVKEIALFAACSESFSQKNINCSIADSFSRFASVVKLAHQHQLKIRGYLSTCFGCPFEGEVSVDNVVDNVKRFQDLGAFEVSIGDTIGVATAGSVETVFTKLLSQFPSAFLAGHFHDTRGQAVANILKSYQMGIRVFDTSISGLGGCPYAPGATGNVATEDVVYLFDGMNVSTGVQLDQLLLIHQELTQHMNRNLPSRVALAGGKLKPKGSVCVI